MGLRRLTDEQIQHKQVLIELAIVIFHGDSKLLNDYSDGDQWRLARVDTDISRGPAIKGLAFHSGDITVARKEEDPGTSMPKILIFSWRTRKHLILKATDPIEFLED